MPFSVDEMAMIICIELTQRSKDHLDRLLDIGHYRDYSEAIAVAIHNQLLLHGEGKDQSSREAAVLNGDSTGSKLGTASVEAKSGSNSNAAKQAAVPEVFSRITANTTKLKVAPFPNDTFIPGEDVPVDRWIFGQHNKLLPVKATCRALANLMLKENGSRDGILLEKVAGEIASEAVRLGDYLRYLDIKSDTHRDDAL